MNADVVYVVEIAATMLLIALLACALENSLKRL